MVHCKLCEKLDLERSEKWYLHNAQAVTENFNHKLTRDMNIQCDNFIVKRKPGIVIVNKMSNTTIIIDVEIAGDKRITEKEKKKIEKYQTSRREI